MTSENAPILSTPAEHILEEPTPATIQSSETRLSEEQLYLQYEIRRTVDEIREGKWKRIALQFPDDMLVDAPRVVERIQSGLREERKLVSLPAPNSSSVDQVTTDLTKITLQDSQRDVDLDDVEERLCILADTSYGACCVDEVAAEHVDAEVVVHYGRACLSPTARLHVIYVFTSKPVDMDAAVQNFKSTYNDKDEKVCLMADIPYSHHLDELQCRLESDGYSNIFKTTIIRDPKSPLPNRTVPADVQQDRDALKAYSVFHVATPPTSLLLILSSRIKVMHIFDADDAAPAALEAATSQILRRRYAIITRLSTVPIFGILINTLSVSNYMDALAHCQDVIRRAGKKSYTFVVGKVNAAKVANFAEIGGWVVIGCWESSLIESKDFFRPIITPFELEVALQGDEQRTWGGDWIGDFSALLGKTDETDEKSNQQPNGHAVERSEFTSNGNGNWDDEESDDEPPEFDLRTGRYVSHSRPMGRLSRPAVAQENTASSGSTPAPPSSALVQRAKGDVASIGGQISPAAEYLRSKRTWQGLGSDFEISYERDENGKIRGAAMEEGRSGVAKGYSVGEDASKS